MREILTPHQQRAAALLGRGARRADVAREVGATVRTLSRWKHEPEFQAAMRRARAEAFDERSPTARAVLERALTATDGRGRPDWKVRLRAAELLLAAPPEPPAEGERTGVATIYAPPPGDDA